MKIRNRWRTAEREVRVDLAREALRRTAGNITQAAALLDISRERLSHYVTRHAAELSSVLGKYYVCRACGHRNTAQQAGALAPRRAERAAAAA